MPRPRLALIVALLAVVIPVAFTCVTNHVWEDYLITLRSSRNLVEGNGLVFTPGERLHTFTSPLGVLLPAACLWIAGVSHAKLALWLFRILSVGTLAAAAALVARRLQALGVGALGLALSLGLFLCDSKLADFVTNGMETAFVVLFAMLLWDELERPAGPRPAAVAVAASGLMWARPDGFILGAALILPRFILRNRRSDATPLPWAPVAKGIGAGIILYLPWLVFATWYYGTPVPHTIVAKSAITPPVHLRTLLLMPWYSLTGQSTLMDVFLPTYWFYGNWPAWLPRIAHLLSVVAAFAWLIPALPVYARRVSLATFLGMFYVCSIILFPWYSPPWTLIAALAVGCTVDAVFRRCREAGRPALASALRVTAALLVMMQAGVLVAATWEMHIQQRFVENDVRKQIGLWLHDHSRPGDTVFMEPLGYIGYYSGLKTYDYPGLSSRAVTDVIRAGHRRLTEVINQLRPTWLVMRPFEIADVSLPQNAVWHQYTLVRAWDSRPLIDSVGILPGRGWVDHDSEFLVFHYRGRPASVPGRALASRRPPRTISGRGKH